MPRIEIKENEEISLAAFDATENTVLIPMLYARETIEVEEGNVEYSEYKDGKIPGRKFTNASDFRSAYLSKVVTVGTNYDKSYIMAFELLLQGLNVVVKPIAYDNITLGRTIDIEKAYEIIENALANGAFDEFKDRNLHNIKFITSGGYSNCGQPYVIENEEGNEETLTTTSYTYLRDLAASRGDAIALVEFKEEFDSDTEIIESINESFTPSGENDNFVNALLPWFSCYTTSRGSVRERVSMPASFGYLMAYGNDVKTSANWFAAAGVQRGWVPNLIEPRYNVGEALMHILQGDDSDTSVSICVNPIYNAGIYGYRIWGNRVANKPTTSDLRFVNFLNVRILLCDLRKQLYHSAMRVTFEPNDDIVWINYKTLNNPLLDRMKSGRGIRFYKWYKEPISEKATIKCSLVIRPIEALENIIVNVVLTDEEASISEQV